MRRPRMIAKVACGLVMLPLMGCAIGTDLINPALLTQLGLDIATVIPQTGVTIVTFTNSTNRFASFFAVVADDADDLAAGIMELESDVPAGVSRSEAVDCTFESVTFGQADFANFTANTAAAVVIGAAGGAEAVTVAYLGAPLEMGSDFLCGDVIEAELIEIAGVGEEQGNVFALRVRVVRGR